MDHKIIIKSFIFSSISAALGSVVAIRTSYHIDKFTKECQENKQKHKSCFLYLNPYITNLSLFVLTFITSFLLYMILFYIFGLKK